MNTEPLTFNRGGKVVLDGVSFGVPRNSTEASHSRASLHPAAGFEIGHPTRDGAITSCHPTRDGVPRLWETSGGSEMSTAGRGVHGEAVAASCVVLPNPLPRNLRPETRHPTPETRN